MEYPILILLIFPGWALKIRNWSLPMACILLASNTACGWKGL